MVSVRSEYEGETTFDFSSDTVLVEDMIIMNHCNRPDVVGISFNGESTIFVLTKEGAMGIARAFIAYAQGMEANETTQFINQGRQ